MVIEQIIGEEAYQKTLNKIMETLYTPALKLLKEKNEKLYLYKLEGGIFYPSNEIIKAKKVGQFCYIEEEYFSPIKQRCESKGLELTDIEIDTKLLKTWNPDLDFDAYSFDPIGEGLNIDGMTRINGRLYKIIR